MDLARAFTYPFEDREWIQKILIAGLISLIPILGWIVVGGWALEVTRRIIQGEGEALPGWDDFGSYISRGIKVFVIALVYSLPVLVFSICNGVFSAMAAPDMSSDTAQGLAGLVGLVALCFSCLSFFYSLFMAVILPAALGHFVASGDDLAAAFRFGEVFALVRDNLGAYVMVFVGSLLAGFVAGLGIIACGIGLLFTGVYAGLVNVHLYGQAYRQATGGAVTPAATTAV